MKKLLILSLLTISLPVLADTATFTFTCDVQKVIDIEMGEVTNQKIASLDGNFYTAPIIPFKTNCPDCEIKLNGIKNNEPIPTNTKYEDQIILNNEYQFIERKFNVIDPQYKKEYVVTIVPGDF